MPDYSLYGITDHCYGFLTRGCPRNCDFCHVSKMQSRCSVKVADLSEFWSGQKYIVLLDPNMMACREWKDLAQQLIDSKSYVDFSQGLDLRIMNPERWEYLNRIKLKSVHFAWDRPTDDMEPRFQDAAEHMHIQRGKHSVYILTNFNSTLEQDIHRVETVKKYGFQPYVMIYNQTTAPQELRKLKRYANNPYVCWATPTFADYVTGTRSDRYEKTGQHREKAKKYGML